MTGARRRRDPRLPVPGPVAPTRSRLRAAQPSQRVLAPGPGISPYSRLDADTLVLALDALVHDPAIARGLAAAGRPALRQRPPGFPTLLRIVLGQQLSVASAAAIWARLEAMVDPLTPERLLALAPEGHRAIGLSRQKSAFALAIAAAVAEGRLDLDRVAALEDEAAVDALTAVRGIGRWTAEIYLLFALGRPDVWPAGDLALAEAGRRLLDLPARPDPKTFRELGARWAPWRGAVAHLLWHYYGTVVV